MRGVWVGAQGTRKERNDVTTLVGVARFNLAPYFSTYMNRLVTLILNFSELPLPENFARTGSTRSEESRFTDGRGGEPGSLRVPTAAPAASARRGRSAGA